MTTHTRAGSPLRLLQIGMGNWGRDWLKIIAAETGIETVGWVDTSPTSLEACRVLNPNVPCFSSLTEALSTSGADAALITASLPAHAPLARAALEAGLHVLLEKPFAPSLEDAQELVALAARMGRNLMVSQNYRYHPAPRLAAKLVQEGTLGQVGSVSVAFRQVYARQLPPEHPYHRSFQPLLLDMAIHHFDLMRFVLGRAPEEIHCRSWNPAWSRFRDPASAAATVLFEGGVVVDYAGTWATSGSITPWAGLWHIDCEDGQIIWTSRDNRAAGDADSVTVQRMGEKAETLELPPVSHYDRAGSLHEFVRSVREGLEPGSSGHDNLGTLALSLAAIASAESGRAVTLGNGSVD